MAKIIGKQENALKTFLERLNRTNPSDLPSHLRVVASQAIELNSEIERQMWSKLISKTLKPRVLRRGMSPDELIRNIRSIESEYLKKRQDNYTLLTYLSVKPFWALQFNRTKRIDEARITLGDDLPVKFRNSRACMISKASPFVRSIHLTNQLPCRVTVKARSPEEAYHRAGKYLDRLRGIWTYLRTVNRRRWFGGLPPVPLNPVLRGPIETIHKGGGAICDELPNTWYYPDYPKRIVVQSLTDEVYKTLEVGETTIRKQLKRSKLAPFVLNAYSAYARSLDTIDVDRAFIQLWYIL